MIRIIFEEKSPSLEEIKKKIKLKKLSREGNYFIDGTWVGTSENGKRVDRQQKGNYYDAFIQYQDSDLILYLTLIDDIDEVTTNHDNGEVVREVPVEGALINVDGKYSDNDYRGSSMRGTVDSHNLTLNLYKRFVNSKGYSYKQSGLGEHLDGDFAKEDLFIKTFSEFVLDQISKEDSDESRGSDWSKNNIYSNIEKILNDVDAEYLYVGSNLYVDQDSLDDLIYALGKNDGYLGPDQPKWSKFGFGLKDTNEYLDGRPSYRYYKVVLL